MKRMLALALALVMAMSLGVCFTSCGQKNADDLAYVKDKGKLVVGITEFEPMDYKDADGKWVGFDADTATAFAQYIGVDVEFVLIDWDSKSGEVALMKYMDDQRAKEDKVFDNPALMKTPVVRNGKQATVGYCPEIWAAWE